VLNNFGGKVAATYARLKTSDGILEKILINSSVRGELISSAADITFNATHMCASWCLLFLEQGASAREASKYTHEDKDSACASSLMVEACSA
jgi:hypothetical protein